jgi:DNA-binding CsgD family transcriptional regulator
MINPLLIPKLVTLPRDPESDFNPVYVGLIANTTSTRIKSKFDSLLYLNDNKHELFKTMEKVIQQLGATQPESDNTTLSERELSILKLVATGNTNNEIAERLFISTHTVMTHRKNITRKLGIKTVSGLTVYAILNQHINMEEVQGSEQGFN